MDHDMDQIKPTLVSKIFNPVVVTLVSCCVLRDLAAKRECLGLARGEALDAMEEGLTGESCASCPPSECAIGASPSASPYFDDWLDVCVLHTSKRGRCRRGALELVRTTSKLRFLHRTR